MKALKLVGSSWRRDDGKPGLAFVGIVAEAKDAKSYTIWIANCTCQEYLACPLAKALEYIDDHDDSAYHATTIVRKRSPR